MRRLAVILVITSLLAVFGFVSYNAPGTAPTDRVEQVMNSGNGTATVSAQAESRWPGQTGFGVSTLAPVYVVAANLANDVAPPNAGNLARFNGQVSNAGTQTSATNGSFTYNTNDAATSLGFSPTNNTGAKNPTTAVVTFFKTMIGNKDFPIEAAIAMLAGLIYVSYTTTMRRRRVRPANAAGWFAIFGGHYRNFIAFASLSRHGPMLA